MVSPQILRRSFPMLRAEGRAYAAIAAPYSFRVAFVGGCAAVSIEILRRPEVNSSLTKQGAEVLGGTPQAFAAYIKSEIPKWAKVVRDSGARAD